MQSRTNEAVWVDARLRWQINVQRDGKRRTFCSSRAGSRGKVEAEKKADKWISEGLSKDPRFEKAWEGFIADQKARTGTGNWKQREGLGKRWLLPAVKHKKVSSITNQDWQDILNKAYKKGLAKKSISNIKGTIMAFYKYAKKNRFGMVEPEDLVIPADAPVVGRMILQPDQFKVLFAYDTVLHYGKARKCFYINYWRMLVLTGLRPGEAAGLRMDEDLQEQLLRIKRAVNVEGEVTGGKNERAQRQMILTRRALAVYADQVQMLKEKGIKTKWLFPDEDGEQMSQKRAYKQWERYRVQYGIKSDLYALRHSMISYGKADLPEQLMKLLVGHGANMDTFGVYGHELDGDLQRAADIMDAVFDRLLGENTSTQSSTQSISLSQENNDSKEVKQ